MRELNFDHDAPVGRAPGQKCMECGVVLDADGFCPDCGRRWPTHDFGWSRFHNLANNELYDERGADD